MIPHPANGRPRNQEDSLLSVSSQPMEKTTKTFRIFVSSTFSDLKEERNALQKPNLR
jgi:hypothetical protein